MNEKPEALQFADDRPSSWNVDDLYQWATDAEELIRSMQARITEMEKENASLKQDAERYQLRLETIRALYPTSPSDCELDIAIDHAMQKN